MNVRHRPDRHNWPKLKQILDEFQLCSPSVAGYYRYRSEFQSCIRFLSNCRDLPRDLKCEVSADSRSDRLFIEISLETVSIIWNWIFQFCQKFKHWGISGTNSIVKRVILKISKIGHLIFLYFCDKGISVEIKIFDRIKSYFEKVKRRCSKLVASIWKWNWWHKKSNQGSHISLP